MADEPTIRAAFAQQAAACRTLGSPFTALVVEQVGLRLDRTSATGRRILDWPGVPDAYHDALPLRVAGGLHARALTGAWPALSACWPPGPRPSPGALWQAIGPAIADPAFDVWLDNPPQTNECGRAAALMAGLLVIAQATARPMALFELGASAGLNLMLDRYHYQLGHLAVGPSDSAVRLQPDWTGPSPPASQVEVVGRCGVDLRPVDIRLAADRERLVAYVWADQAERLARMRAALAITAADPPAIECADAADWIERRLDPAPQPDVMRVVMHSIAFQYFPPASQGRIAAHMARVGAAATAEAPLAWLRLEADPAHGNTPSLQLTLWPGGATRVLALGHAHGAWVRWAG